MTLKTASIVDLRESNTAAVVPLMEQLDQASFPYRGKDRTAAERLDQLLERRVLIENTSSKLSQLEAFAEKYGKDSWHDRYVRLSQVTAPAGCQMNVQELREAVWRAVPSSKFRRFQELFCDPHNISVPHFNVDKQGRVSFVGNPDFSKMSVASCLISIDRISDEFAENVRLLSFTETERRSPLKRFVRKADIVVVEKLKLLWDSCEPLSRRDFRALIIQRPSRELIADYPKAAGFPPGLHGTILYTREDFSNRVDRENPLLGPKRMRPLRVQHFVTVYDAYRKTLHAAHGYKVEQEQLVPLSSKVRMGRLRIGAEWKKGAPQEQKDDVRAQVGKTLRQGSQALKDDSNEHKVRAVDLMKKVQDSRDRTGRLNPTATAVVMERSERHLGRRIGEMRAKSRHNQADEDLLGEIIAAEETILGQFGFTLASNADAVILDRRDSATRSTIAPMRTKPASVVLGRLVPDRRALESITARPFSTFAGLLRVGCTELESSLHEKRYKEVEQAVVKLHIISKLFAANANIQRMKDYLVDPDTVPVDKLKRELQDISATLKVQILKKVHVEEYEKRFRALSVQVLGLDEILEASPTPRASASEREAYFKKLKRALDAVVPEKLAWELVPRWRRASGQSELLKNA